MSHPRACPACLRRSSLLELLGPYLERLCRGGIEIAHMLSLDDDRLAHTVEPKLASHLLARAAAFKETELRDAIENAECWATCRHDDRYPDSLRATDPKAALIGRGDSDRLADLDGAATATVVGSRRASAYGREVARSLGRDLAVAGVGVISGLSFGIDASAHRGALDAERPTVAVLPSGADGPYPAAHRSLWRRICERGLVVSELPPGASPWRWTFAARNRILAALGDITIVVEAAERSGSLVTAELAADLGRPIGAVPGPVNSRVSAGTNGMLAAGGVVVRSAEDVLSALPPSAPAPLPRSREAEPAYTVVGFQEYGLGSGCFVETFFTFGGPLAAEALARKWAREQGKGEILIAAVLDGEVKPTD